MTAAPLLRVAGLRAGYGPVEVLHGVDLEVGAGEVVALLGANGAGKTTTLMALSRVVPGRADALSFAGHDLHKYKAHEVVPLGLAHAPEGRRIFPRLTVLENLRLGAFTRADRAGVAADLEEMFGLFPVLRARQSQPGGLLSGGEQQMLAIARALMARPKLLLLDEPSLGLAPQVVAQVFDVIRGLTGRGVAVLLVEQNAVMALKVAARGYVLEAGRVTAAGPAGDLLADPRVRAAYLGE